MSTCGCECTCHTFEHSPWWPGPCAACCETGMDCAHGRYLDRMYHSRARKGANDMRRKAYERIHRWG